jgi:hypothetical protein
LISYVTAHKVVSSLKTIKMYNFDILSCDL